METLLGGILNLLFVGNIFGVESILWSVCVEFQFYLISPFIVKKMYNSKKPWLIVLAFFLASAILNLGMNIWND
jgi:peptidoglycan/LPS O-acetylase OafA/YrhL